MKNTASNVGKGSVQAGSGARGGKVRLKDVAAAAGVAVNTASTILNRRPNSWASKETEERVFKAASELGYRPNRAALGLRIGRFNAVGLLVADINNPFYTAFAHFLTLEAERQGYDVVIETWRNDLQRELACLDDILDRQVDGVVAFLSDHEVHRKFLSRQFAAGMPFVVVGTVASDVPPVDSVLADFRSGLRAAIDHLYASGHRQYAFVCALAGGQSDGQRAHFFKELLAERHLSPGSYEIVRCGPEISDAHAAARKLLASPRRPTAVVALNDLGAMGVLRAASELGLRVPAELSVVGVDDTPIGKYLPVSLSTIAQPLQDMARRAWSLMFERIEEAQPKPHMEQALFSTTFVRRETSGPLQQAERG
jgi:LacI family transcriptional regulator